MSEPANTANAATTPETLSPLTEMEAALVGAVGKWRDDQQRQLEIAWQRVLSEANERITPVLRAHGLRPGDEWDIRQDAASATGWAIAIKKGALSADESTTPENPLNRTTRRRLQKEIAKRVVRGGKR